MQETGEVWLDPRAEQDQARLGWSPCAEICGQAWPPKRRETIYFLRFTLYGTRNQNGNFRVGHAYEKSYDCNARSHAYRT